MAAVRGIGMCCWPWEVDEEERWRRAEVVEGMSKDVLEVEVVEATEAECARRAVSSRVRRLTLC